MGKSRYAETVWGPDDVVRIAKEQGFELEYDDAARILDELEDDIQIAQMQAGEAIIKREVTLT